MVRHGTSGRSTGLIVMLILVLASAVTWAAPGAGRAYPEAKMQVATDGMTAAEHMQRQAEMSQSLAAELPLAAQQNAIRIAVAPAEIAAIDGGSRYATPLKIGFVKPMAPAMEINGLVSDQSIGQALRGVPALAERTEDGGFVWAMVVTSEQTGAIRLHVEGLSLPDNAALYLYSLDGQANGPYTGDGPNGTGEFWTATIFGPEAILQVRVSPPADDDDLRAVSLRVSEAGLITRNFVEGLRPPQKETAAPPPPGWPCGNAACIEDASCFNGTPAEPAKLAVAKMEWVQGAFLYTCSGGLISDNNPTQNNFFLTANHCVSKNNSAQNINFYWRFATVSCESSQACPSNSGWPYQTGGSTVSKTGRKGDFTLLHLSSNPPSGSVFLGWNSTPVANTPGHDLWRISNPGFGPQVYSTHDVDTAAPTCSGWPRGERIYSRDIVGAIDGGSSGSPVVNAASQIVGQLSGTCGFNPSQVCSSGPGEDNATVDGAFAFYFALVQPFLNP